ncbi:bifunctional oligoribonuclease/PAP phosphatase NrnA [Streptacidiphilus sp. ASG 303]|uniref:DHH family phosphoesterase n=1 Tax=Streptacidiphilus sp. ASG 303 TaxID=2896847 RepID=UPI001E4FEFEB|nr:bifunctional oligoribonuclease/PAP phosphatase NrnA [Streptacidiphilus sp. ASG 303]MCD0486178.1 bifunctional oligoribonuclease/PAP phosphatase NrnA [Streptacidiphilus sp. ASG 303]
MAGEPPAAAAGAPSAEPAEGAPGVPLPRVPAGAPDGSGPDGSGSGGHTAPGDREWDEVVALVAAAREVDLVCHVRPDGDALGSALAAGLALRSLGLPVRVSFGDDPQVVPASLAFLPGQELLVPAAEVPDRPDLVITFDVAAEGRLGLLRHKALAARATVVLDHHASNPGFGTHRLIDPAAPATAVLVDELLRRLGVPLDEAIATCLYTGVATDTGSFKYRATTPGTHELAGRLLATGIRHDLISRTLWDTSSFGYLKVLSAALERAALDPAAADGLGMVWTWVPHADLAAHGVAVEEVEGLIDVVRRTAEADVALVLKEDPDGTLRGSSRSKGAVDVAAACGALDGGGHVHAAGFSSRHGLERTLELFRGALRPSAGPPA